MTWVKIRAFSDLFRPLRNRRERLRGIPLVDLVLPLLPDILPELSCSDGCPRCPGWVTLSGTYWSPPDSRSLASCSAPPISGSPKDVAVSAITSIRRRFEAGDSSGKVTGVPLYPFPK